MNKASMLKPALIGGVALGILSAIPGLSFCNCVCCAWAIGGGILAAYLYIKDSPFRVTMGRGAGVGFVAGAIGAVVCCLFSIPIQLLSSGEKNSGMIVEQFNEYLAKNPDFPDEARQTIEAILQRGDLMLIIAFLCFLVLFPLFSMMGGAIGVSIFEKRKPGNAQTEIKPTRPPVNMPPPEPPGDY